MVHPEEFGRTEAGTSKTGTHVTLGRRLRDLRVKAGLSQQGLAAGICSRTYVARIEADSRFPGAQMLAGFAGRLGASLASLLPYYLSSPMVGPRQCLAMARELAARGEVDAARRSLAKAKEFLADEDPSHPLFYSVNETEGLIHYGAGNFEKAASLLESTLQNEKDVSSGRSLTGTRLSLGLALLRGKDHPGAAAALVRALAEVVMAGPASGGPEGRGGRSQTFFKIIEGLMQTALEISEPGLALLIYDFAGGYMDVTGWSRTIPPPIELHRAVADMRMGRFGKARTTLERLCHRSSPDITARAHLNLGILGRFCDDWLVAEHHLKVAWHMWSQKGYGSPLPIARELARLYLQRRSTAEAEKWVEKVLALTEASDRKEAEVRADSNLLKARLAYLKGDYSDARKLAASALPLCSEGEHRRGGKQLARVIALKAALKKGSTDEAFSMLAHIEKDIELKTL